MSWLAEILEARHSSALATNHVLTDATGIQDPGSPFSTRSVTALIVDAIFPDNTYQRTPEGQNIVVQVCYQELDRVEINVNFETTEMQISTSQLPVITKPDAEKLLVPGTNETAFQFRIQTHLDNALLFFENAENPFSSVAGDKIVDRFFQGLFFGPETMRFVNQSDSEYDAG